MLFPIGDDNSDRTAFPFVNYLFIAANIVVFVLFQALGANDVFTYAYSVIPREITTGTDLQGLVPVADSFGRVVGRIPLQPSPQPVYLTILSSMFMHGGFMHIAGNMLYLWIFGDNLEDRLGHLRYAVFYLVCGALAALAQIATDQNSVIPMLGASGAISGVLGGYLILFPRRRVLVIMFSVLTHVPAYVALGIWIGFQILSNYFADATTGGVAYMAHIGGFVAGFLLVKVFAIGTKPPTPLPTNY